MANAKDLSRVWAASPLMPTRDPGVAKWNLGFIAEIPTYQTLNYIHNRMDTNILALAERGVFEWGGDIDYLKGASAWDANGKVYVAKVANPDKTKTPSTNLIQWEESVIQVPKAQFTVVENLVINHINNMANPHNLTAAQLNTYTKAEYDAFMLSTNQDIAAHLIDYTNSHKVTATQAGAVPITGGTYTGQVLFSTGIIGLGTNTTNAVQSTGGRVFLKKGTLELGINASGKAYFKNATETLLLDETLFLDLKRVNEVLYAVPQPDVEYNFLSDINCLKGMGYSEFTSTGGKSYLTKEGAVKLANVDEPRHTVTGIAFIDNTETLRIERTFDGKGFPEYTEHVEIYLDSVSNNSTTELMTDESFGNSAVYIDNAHQVRYRTYDNTLAANVFANIELNPTVGRHSFTKVVLANGTVKLYWDGVLKNTIVLGSYASRAVWQWTRFMYVLGADVNTSHNRLQRWRCWAIPLSDAQISTL